MAYELKTRATAVDPDAFIAAAQPAERATDGAVLAEMMGRVTGLPPKMWGPSIVGFGSYSYRYASGHSGEMCRIGFSPRRPHLVIYIAATPERPAQLERLGKHSNGTGCLYIKRLSGVDLGVLEEMIRTAWASDKLGC